MRTAALCLLAVCTQVSAFVPQLTARQFSRFASQSSIARGRSNVSRLSMSNDDKNTWDAIMSDWSKKLATAAAIGAVAFSAPGEALAARSGGRVGGRSFSAPTQRMSPGPSRGPSTNYAPSPSYRSGGGGVSVMPVPVPLGGGFGSPFGSPFGYSPFGYSPFGYSPFARPGVSFYGGGFGVNPVDLLLLGGVAYGVSKLVQGGGQSFGNLDDQPPSSLGEGVDVLKLQIALNCRDRGSNSILGVLNDLSEQVDTESREGLATVVSEISLALARRRSDWIAAASQLEHFNNRNAERAEATFSQYSVQLRSKVERETKSVVGGLNLSVPRSGVMGRSGSFGGSTVAVVNIVLALRGDALKKLGLDRSVNSASGLRTALETLAATSMTDGGDNVLAAEVLWTPEDASESLTREEAIEDFPELLDL